MENEGPGFAVIDEDGIAFYIAETYDEALRVAAEAIPEADVWYEGPPPWEESEPESMAMAANTVIQLRTKKVAFGDEPRRAFGLLTGLKPMTNEQVEAISLEDAYDAMRPFFPTSKTGANGAIKKVDTYSSPSKMVDRMFGGNHKIVKSSRPGVPKSQSTGLSLMPSNNWERDDIEKIVAVAASKYGIKKVKLPPGRRTTLCASATAQCKASCLVFSGQNLNDRYNTIKKLSLTMALFHEPVAFMRMLYAAVEQWQRECSCEGSVPFLRLNVYSDIPWELLAPDMFERFRDVRFYDYTKVAGRMPFRGGKYPVENYDLTFSYSGSQPNLEAINYEVRENRRRVAVTFATIGTSRLIAPGKAIPTQPPRPGTKETAHRWPYVPEVGLPSKFMGLTVIDGDQSDFRPYDPPFNVETGQSDLDPCVVGLRWKIPQLQQVTAAQARLFIVPGYLVKSEGARRAKSFVVMEVPRYTAAFPGTAPPWKDLDFSDIATIEEAD
jgi:hypothetical protein